MPRRILAGILGLALWCCAAGAQDWPARTVTVYVPFIAGSTPDSLARIVAERLMPEHVLRSEVVQKALRGGHEALKAVVQLLL